MVKRHVTVMTATKPASMAGCTNLLFIIRDGEHGLIIINRHYKPRHGNGKLLR